MNKSLTLLFFAFHSPIKVSAFLGVPLRQSRMETSCFSVTSDISLESYDGSRGVEESLIKQSANFMMESFWGVEGAGNELLSEQEADLGTRFGEIMGKRKLDSNLILGKMNDEIAGLVGVEVGLFDLKTNAILNYKTSDKMLTDAVASLGPKQRRQFKDSSIDELVRDLPNLQGSFEAVAVLANLCVSPKSRGKSLGKSLCSEVEVVVKNWGLTKIMLKVEDSNDSAKALYEKLGYRVIHTDTDSTTIRPDTDNGTFKEQECAMLTMCKSI